MAFYDQTPNPDVLQREWVEAAQALAHATATLERARTEARNAEANFEAAKSKCDDLEAAYDEALKIRRAQQVSDQAEPVPSPKRPAKAAPPQGI